MNALLGTVYIFWIVRILVKVATYIHLWYTKEYRLDRMLIHLRSPGAKRLLYPTFRRPPMRPKTLVLFGGSLITLGVFLFALPFHPIISLILVDLLTFPVVFILVLFVQIPTFIYHRLRIYQAIYILHRHKPMTVIGITGSYGKTSTKEILYTILSQKYKTLKTVSSQNSPIAIAELVIANLKPDHELFIVEMGAYKKGEIAQMCALVRPQIAIITAINPQHQDLFGSIENTIAAKYELIQGLVGARTAVMNADNEYVDQMAKKAELEGCHVIRYSAVKNKNKTVQARGEIISTDARGINLSYVYAGVKTNLSVHLLGAHQISNMLAAIAVAHIVGMNDDEIVLSSKSIRPFDKTMSPVKGLNGSFFIDDTFNNNPDAALAAIKFLALQKGKKYFVFQPMIELGTYAIESHENVGKAVHVLDEVILTNDSYLASLKKYNTKTPMRVLSAQEGADYLRAVVRPGDTVLFKGKESGRMLQLLI